MTAPPPPPDGYRDDGPKKFSASPSDQERGDMIGGIFAENARHNDKHRGSIFWKNRRIRAVTPKRQAIGAAIDLFVTAILPLILGLNYTLFILGLVLANSVVLQGLTGRTIGKYATGSVLVMEAGDSRRMVFMKETYWAAPGMRRAFERLVYNILTFPSVFSAQPSGLIWSNKADEALGFSIYNASDIGKVASSFEWSPDRRPADSMSRWEFHYIQNKSEREFRREQDQKEP